MHCRACMQVDCEKVVDMNYATSGDDGKTLYDYFNECTQLQATSNDELPQILCSTCIEDLYDAYNFINRARTSDGELKKLLTLQKADTDIYTTTQTTQYVVECINDPLASPERQIAVTETFITAEGAEMATPASEIKIELELPEDFDNTVEDHAVKSYSDSSLQGNSDVVMPGVTHSCELCDCTYLTQKELKDHIFDMHKSDIICMKCPKVYELPTELRLHETLVHSTETSFQCVWCKESFQREELPKHIRKKHRHYYLKYFPRIRIHCKNDKTNSLRCDDCYIAFPSILELASHVKDHKFDCPLCLMSFTKYGSYRAHVKRTHNHSISSLKAAVETLLVEPLMEFPNGTISVEKSCKSPNRSFEEAQMEIVKEVASVTITEPQDTSLQTKNKHTNVVTTNDSVNNCTGSLFRSLVVDEGEDKPIECKPCNKSYTRLGSNNYHKITESTDINDIEETTDNEIVDILDIEEYKASIAKTESEQSPSPADLAWEAESKKVESDENILGSEENNLVDQVPKESLKKQQQKQKTIPQSKGNKGYFCSFCPRVLTSNRSLQTHEKTQHLGRKKDIMKECPICRKKMYSDYIKKHIRMVHIGERNNVCDICGGRYKTFNTLQRHKLLHMADRQWQCSACDMKFAEKSALNRHMRLHTGEMPLNDMEETTDNEIVDILDIEAYKASIAKKESEEIPSLADVTWEAESKKVESDKNILESEQNVDQVPQESVKKQQQTKKTIPQSKGKKGYFCSFCSRVLTSNRSLQTHEKTQHLGRKKDIMKECPICQKKMYMDYIKKHIRNVHVGERNNVCDICGGRYKTFNTLQRHKLLHMADRKWQCSACDKKFAEKSALNIHMRLHTGEKPFACPLCDRRFRIGSHLTYHLERHANIKKKCNVCGKEFTSATSLRKHSFLHTGDMPYKCTDCDYETAKREYFISHTLRKHDRKMTEDELFLMFKRNTGETPRVKNFESLNKLFENSGKSDHSN